MSTQFNKNKLANLYYICYNSLEQNSIVEGIISPYAIIEGGFRMKILFVASEAVPFAKTGGLADVAYSLPKALRDLGHDVRIVLPMYKNIIDNYSSSFTFVKSYGVPMNWRHQHAGVFEYTHENITYYFIDNQFFFNRDGYYGYGDDGERFAYYSKAVLDTICVDIFVPDILHLNDWQTAPIALLLKDPMYENAAVAKAKTIYTIHNLHYQGIFPINMLGDLYGLDNSYLTADKIEFNGSLNFSKAGIVYADLVTTVSRTYAKELKYEFFGEKLEGVIATHEHKIKGIVNGLDYDQYNPMTDPNLFERYGVEDAIAKKNKNKAMLQRLLRLDDDPKVPLIAMVTRLVDHKGIGLVLRVIKEMLDIPAQFIVLGTGERGYEDAFKVLDNQYPEKMSAHIYFDNKMASRIYAASDIFLMPSMIEPCGIGQLIAMRYGSIPVVRQTGGLMDTVQSYNQYDKSGNGFGFMNINAHEMLSTVKTAVSLYTDNHAEWEELVNRAMTTDSSWTRSASEYIECYKSVLE